MHHHASVSSFFDALDGVKSEISARKSLWRRKRRSSPNNVSFWGKLFFAPKSEFSHPNRRTSTKINENPRKSMKIQENNEKQRQKIEEKTSKYREKRQNIEKNTEISINIDDFLRFPRFSAENPRTLFFQKLFRIVPRAFWHVFELKKRVSELKKQVLLKSSPWSASYGVFVVTATCAPKFRFKLHRKG